MRSTTVRATAPQRVDLRVFGSAPLAPWCRIDHLVNNEQVNIGVQPINCCPGRLALTSEARRSCQPAAVRATRLTALTKGMAMDNGIGRFALRRPRHRKDYRLDVLLVVLLTLLSLLVLGLSVGAN